MIETEPGKVPEGVVFGSKVARIPPINARLCHSSGVVGLFAGKKFTWIKRGAFFAKYVIISSKKESHEIYLRSPVSGLILHSMYDLGNIESECIGTRMAILLPDDEHAAEDGGYIFSELCKQCWENRAPFLKPSTRVTRPAMTEDFLRKILDAQREYSCTYIDAMPEYSKYISLARTEHPQLRPYLKHLFTETIL